MGCTAGPAAAPSSDGNGAVVAILALEPARPLDSHERAQYVRVCSAFAVRGLAPRPGVWLVTAEHCAFASRVRYLSPNGWGQAFATVEFTDKATDFALLRPDDPSELVPYSVSYVPRIGENVRSLSAVYAGDSRGRLTTWLSGPYFETSQTIVFGWSGSPVIDSGGRVFAFVSKCPWNESFTACQPGRTIVSALP